MKLINLPSQRGSTMLEVLIAIVVLSLGLLGYAGLQSVSIKNNHNAYLRSQATVLAYDVLDRMRANKAGEAGYAMDYGSPPSSADALQWQQLVQSTLPNGDADVKILASGVVIVKVKWFDGDSTADREFITQSRL